MGIPFADRTYDVIASLCAVVTLGVVLFAARTFIAARQARRAARLTPPVRRPPSSRRSTGRWGCWSRETAFVLVGVVFYNLRYLQPQGRYLFPALPALAIFAVIGIGELIRERYTGLVLLLTGLGLCWLCVFSLFSVIGPSIRPLAPR